MSTELASTNDQKAAPLAGLPVEVQSLAHAFVASGFFSDTKKMSQAIVKIMAGRELGFPPMASMQGIHVIQGKVTLSANLLGAAIKRSGRYSYRVTQMTREACSVEFFEHGESIGTSDFTMDDAKAAGVMGNPTWKKYPRNMLFARALSNGARWYTPDVFGGALYTPEEMGADVDGETGEPLNIPALTVPAGEAETTTITPLASRLESTSDGFALCQQIVASDLDEFSLADALAETMLAMSELAQDPLDLQVLRDAYGSWGGGLGAHKDEIAQACQRAADSIQTISNRQGSEPVAA